MTRSSFCRSLFLGALVLALVLVAQPAIAAPPNPRVSGTLLGSDGLPIADGSVVVETSARKIQHPTGGTVSEIRVRNGDRVKPGDLLVRLDGVEIRSRMEALSHQLAAQRLRVARLTAERDDQPELAPALEVTALAPEANTAAMIASEKSNRGKSGRFRLRTFLASRGRTRRRFNNFPLQCELDETIQQPRE